MDLKSRWEEGKGFEVTFWDEWIASKGGQWPEEFRNRMNPNLPLDTHVAAFLINKPDPIDVLDVGAGPLTVLGKVLPDGRKINITAIDPLAEHYQKSFHRHKITPLLPSILGEVEKIDELYGAGLFDLVHMRNSLDHSYNPLLGIRQMLRVVKVGCVVILEHSTNEAEKANYGAFHQWNICTRNSDLILWNRENDINVTSELDKIGKVVARGNHEWTSAVIEKL